MVNRVVFMIRSAAFIFHRVGVPGMVAVSARGVFSTACVDQGDNLSLGLSILRSVSVRFAFLARHEV